MKKDDMTVPVLLLEAVTIVFGMIYIGLQIFYGVRYQVEIYKVICNIAALLLIYGGLTLLSVYPEKVHRLPKELFTAQIRRYPLWMVRVLKYIFVASMMIPCLCDVLGVDLNGAVGLVVVILVIIVVAYYETKIIQIIKQLRK